MEVLGKLLTLAAPFNEQLLALLSSAIIAIATYLLTARVRLVYGRANNSFHVVKANDGPISIYCEKLYVQNTGRKQAEKIEIVLSCAPTELTVFPSRRYNVQHTREGQLSLEIPFLAPRELLIIDTIHINSGTSEIKSVRNPDCVGRQVSFWVLRKLSPWVIVSCYAFMLLGLFYSLLIVIRWLLA